MDNRVVVVSGATGLVGRHLIPALRHAGFGVRVLLRDTKIALTPPEHRYDWHRDDALVNALDGAAALIHLAGEPLGNGRLDEAHRRRVMDSRVHGTQRLVRAWRAAPSPPPLWLQASATGYYGDTGEAEITEESPAGHLFLSEVCSAWERPALELAADGKVRAAIMRFAMVVAEEAPAWERLLQPIRYGLGGKLGSGQQWWSWMTIADLTAATLFLLEHPQAQGPFNFCAPEPARQIDITRAIARRLQRPAFGFVPAMALRALAGALADELILPSCRALPQRLQGLGFKFQAPTIEAALDQVLCCQ